MAALTDSKIDELIAKSFEMKARAYCPYSKFHVGAALLCEDDTIYTGCNVENASYGLSICAERTAIVKAISDGHRRFKAIAVSLDSSDYASPCGACRQFMIEFGLDWKVYLTKPDLTYIVRTTKELLPHSFQPDNLLG